MASLGLVRKTSIQGLENRVLPARVARYHRNWSFGHHWPSIKRKSSKWKVHFGGSECRQKLSFTPSPIAFHTKCFQKHLSEFSFLLNNKKMCLCIPNDLARNFGRTKAPAEITTGVELQQLACSKDAPFRMGPQCAQHKCSFKQEFDHNCTWDVNTTDA